jgi:hypothetical protein
VPRAANSIALAARMYTLCVAEWLAQVARVAVGVTRSTSWPEVSGVPKHDSLVLRPGGARCSNGASHRALALGSGGSARGLLSRSIVCERLTLDYGPWCIILVLGSRSAFVEL